MIKITTKNLQKPIQKSIQDLLNSPYDAFISPEGNLYIILKCGILECNTKQLYTCSSTLILIDHFCSVELKEI